jgi:hypothetical protein
MSTEAKDKIGPDYVGIKNGYACAVIPDQIEQRDYDDLVEWLEFIKNKAARRRIIPEAADPPIATFNLPGDWLKEQQG